MRMRVITFAVVVACAVGGCSRKPKPASGVTEGTLRTADGRTRHYRVYTPKGYPSGPPRPLLLVLHGGGGTADGAERTSFTHAAADKHGIIAVYPDGIAKRVLGKPMETWNGGYCCDQAAKEGVDDVAFLVALLDQLKASVTYDTKRVYATGISNGAIMAMRLACERPDRIAGISAVANPGYVRQCANPRPVAVQIIHGTADPCARYGGGIACGGCWERAAEKWLGVPFPPRSFPCTSVRDQAEFWRKVDGCSEDARVTYDHGKARCVEYSTCTSGKTVAVCTIDGGGHTWPGGDLGCDPAKKACRAFSDVTGPINRDLDANDAMSTFFGRFALP